MKENRAPTADEGPARDGDIAAQKRLIEFGGETMLVKEAGHLPHVEAPRSVNERIREFLARQKSS
ncbi:MAG TPA: hypothetical protein VGY52_07525 [Roseiarcus sp.]|jgi:hypothetical protein|nr:hypothetical protein [Roseiarcus sp.]